MDIQTDPLPKQSIVTPYPPEWRRIRMNDYDFGSRAPDLKDIERALEGVNGSVREVLSAINNRPSKSSSGFSDAFIVVFVLYLLSGWSGSKLDRFTDRVYHWVADDASWSNINIERRPSECDFLHSPIGYKGCSVRKNLVVFGDRERKSMFNSATTPEDKNAIWNLPNSVNVSWLKIQEP